MLITNTCIRATILGIPNLGQLFRINIKRRIPPCSLYSTKSATESISNDLSLMTPLSEIAPPLRRAYRKRVQCCATNKSNGKRCTKMVRSIPSAAHLALCSHHKPSERKALAEKLERPALNKDRFRLETRKNTDQKLLLDCWDVWLGDQTCKRTKQKLLREMMKPLSEKDKPGFIYAYSIDESITGPQDKFAYFKIGRTMNLHQRMSSVARKCRHEPEVIESIPSLPGAGKQEESLKKLKNALSSCPIVHRVEYLIQIELSNLYKRANIKCPVCGMRHREWYAIERTLGENGKLMTNQEIWQTHLRPIILRWVQYGVLVSALLNKSQSQLV